MPSPKFGAALLALTLAISLPASAQAQDRPTLKYFNSFTVTGNYVVCGVDLLPGNATVDPDTGKKFVTGTIKVGENGCAAVPANAEIIAAYAFWETIWSDESDLDGARFRGQPVTAVKSSKIDLSLPPYSPCWSGGGGTHWVTMMRADVLRQLPPQLDEDGKPTGRRLVNHSDLEKYQQQFPDGQWPLTVTLPERGVGNQLPQSAGASLLIVWRNPSQPLRTIVVNDGVQIQAPGEATTWTIPGFLQSSTGDAQITHIVGSGSPNSTDRVSFNSGDGFGVIGTNRFDRTSGGASDRAWSNPTFPVTLSSGAMSVSNRNSMPYGGSLDPLTYPKYGEKIQTKVDHLSTNPYDCLSWAAIVFSTTVDDPDADGLVTKLEDVSGLVDPAGKPYPDIYAMGAHSDHKDVFVEVGRMVTAGPTKYGFPVGHPFRATFPEVVSAAHDHMPSAAVLKTVIDVYKTAPVVNPDGASGINVHFDVGSLGASYESAYELAGGDDPAAKHFVLGAFARGGESIAERPPCEPAATPNVDGTPNCKFQFFPGTMGWPTPYQLYLQAPVGNDGRELTAAEANACVRDADGVNTCRQRFDANRQGLFHYVLYAHTRAVSKSPFPCLDASVPPAPVPFNASGHCAVRPNPEHYVARSVSGVAELPGRYAMVSLGQWDNFVGTDFMQASTTVHELLGHNSNLGHGGAIPTYMTLPTGRANVSFVANCIPNYFSSMNYLYQAAGLRGNNGVPYVNLSSTAYGLTGGRVNEGSLFDGRLTPTPPYKAAWYALLSPGTRGVTIGARTAAKHCDGTPLEPGEPGTVAGEPGMGRLDAASVSAVIDWRGDGGATTNEPQDVNFDGKLDALDGFDDWANLRLNQLGAGRNMAGISQGLYWGSLEWSDVNWGVDWNGVDWNGVDWNGVDWNGVDWNGVDWNGVGFGGVDWNGVDWNGVDWNGVDWNGVDWNGVDWNGVDWNGAANGAELDRFVAIESGGGSAPNQLKAFVRGTNGAGGSNSSVPPGEVWVPGGEPVNCNSLNADQCHQVRLDWDAVNVGPASSYSGFRVWDPTGTAEEPSGGSVVVPVGTTLNGTTLTLNDSKLPDDALPDGKRFIYWVRATIDGALRSVSNFAIVTAKNAAPTTASPTLAYTVPLGAGSLEANVATNNAISDADSTSWVVVLRTNVPAGQGSLVLNPNGSFIYTPNGFVGTTSFTYVVNNGPWSFDPSVPLSPNSSEVTVTINVPQVWGFKAVQNLPPPPTKTFKPGSTVVLKWQFTQGGVASPASALADPEIMITDKNGKAAKLTPQEPGHSTFQPPTASNGWTWQLNWQTVDSVTGAALPAGPYTVRSIKNRQTGQSFGPFGPITLK